MNTEKNPKNDFPKEVDQPPKFSKEDIVLQIKGEIKKWCKKWLLFIFGGFSIISAVSLIFMWINIYNGVKNESKKFITKSITEKFVEPNIKNTLRLVAGDKAEAIIMEEVKPAIDNVKSETSKFTDYLSQTKENFSEKYNDLSAQVSILKKRNEFLKLSDRVKIGGYNTN